LLALAADGSLPEFDVAVAASLLADSRAAIVGVTPDGLIETWSRGAQILYGYSAATVLGQPITILDPPDAMTDGASIDAALAGDTVRLETEHIRGDGGLVHVRASVFPVRRDEDTIIGVAYLIQDQSEPEHARQASALRPQPTGSRGARSRAPSEQRDRLELLRASERAESANRAKSEFLARMSHELRSPLNTIIGFGQLLELEELGPRERDHVGLILKAARHLLDDINAVLDVANIEAGQITLSPEPVALADAVRYVFALVAPLARDCDVRLALHTDRLGDNGHVEADRNRLNQVVLNLLSNAIKYNRPGGRVDVSFAVTSTGRVRMSITDTGIGIEHDKLQRLFEPFERLGAERTEVEGTGLGLTLSRGLIEAMGGTIEVSSQPGSGTTFVVELAAGRPRSGHEKSRREDELRKLGSSSGVRSRVLYIEDNVSNLALVERILDRHPGVELIPAMQATIGLELARQHRPDLIVLDLHLPDLSGAETLERLRAKHPEVPVVVLTADAREGQEAHVRRLGAAAYLTKPLDVHRFVDVLAAHLNPRRRN